MISTYFLHSEPSWVFSKVCHTVSAGHHSWDTFQCSPLLVEAVSTPRMTFAKSQSGWAKCILAISCSNFHYRGLNADKFTLVDHFFCKICPVMNLKIISERSIYLTLDSSQNEWLHDKSSLCNSCLVKTAFFLWWPLKPSRWEESESILYTMIAVSIKIE